MAEYIFNFFLLANKKNIKMKLFISVMNLLK